MPTQKIGLFRLVAAHGIGRRIDRLPDQGKPMRVGIVTKIDHGLVSAAIPDRPQSRRISSARSLLVRRRVR